jgi:hypothetical protein
MCIDLHPMSVSADRALAIGGDSLAAEAAEGDLRAAMTVCVSTPGQDLRRMV